MNLQRILKTQTSFVSNHSFSYSRRTFAAKPWFVDEDDEPIPGPSGSKDASAIASTPAVQVSPPPPDAPTYLASTYLFLAKSPLIDPATVHIGTPVPAHAHPDANLPLPMLKTVLKSRGKAPKVPGYGRGVGEGRGQGVYQWEVVAQVKDGAEMRGAVEVVSASVRNMLRREFPNAPRPPKPLHKEQKDGWELLDLGSSAVHICSRKAWERWMDPSREW